MREAIRRAGFAIDFHRRRRVHTRGFQPPTDLEIAVGVWPSAVLVSAEIVKLQPYGAFAALEKNVEGLIHASNIDHLQKNINPSKIFSVGDKVKVKVLVSMAGPIKGTGAPAPPWRHDFHHGSRYV